MGSCTSERTVRTIPTRFKPPISINSSGKPDGGTSLASKPLRVPMKTDGCPSASSSRATASSGITCPPVPPPAITMVAIAFASSVSRVLADAQQHPQTNQRAHQRTAARADHRKRNALGGPHAEHHAHVDESLNDDRRRHAQREVAPEIVVRHPIQLEAAPQNDQESGQNRSATPQSQLFADHRINKIRVRLRQIQNLLFALHEAEAQRPAAANRDFRLLHLV